MAQAQQGGHRAFADAEVAGDQAGTAEDGHEG